jgi:hypothetical protein
MATKTPSGRRFTFTLHNWTQTDWKYLLTISKSNDDIEYLKVAQETGSEGESPHLQGCVVFGHSFKQRPSKVSKILMGPNKDITLPPPNNKHHYHVDIMRGTLLQASEYCGNIAKELDCPVYEYGDLPISKQGERSDFHTAQKTIVEKAQAGCKLIEISEILPRFWAQNEQWVRGIYSCYHKFRVDFFEKNEIFKWQKDLVTYLNDNPPNPRKILFIVDEEGNAGKSEIVRNIEFLFPDKKVFSVPPQDLVSMASLVPDDGVDIVILDCPRQRQYDIAYEFLENLKDGIVVQTKYQPLAKSFVSPHVVVLMNRIPKTGKTILSPDRYVIKEVCLSPEEKARLEQAQIATLPSYLVESMARTREILESCEDEKNAKRARIQDSEGHIYIDNGIFLDGRKKTLSKWKDCYGN